MKMTDVSCKKISFAGKKLRMLGKVSFTAQCVRDGSIFGNFHFKATVIENLQYHFDTHAIAGSKMTSLLNGECDGASSITSSTPSRASPSPPPHARPSAPLQGQARPSAPLLQGHARPSAPPHGRPSPPTSPPGFPSQPSHPPPPDVTSRSSKSLVNGPMLVSNLVMLNQMFGGADTKSNVDDERRTLENIDDDGSEDHDHMYLF